jgi:hypothetical protein
MSSDATSFPTVTQLTARWYAAGTEWPRDKHVAAAAR